jgi:hypothetical protein
MQQIKITVPGPCHENWDNMRPGEKGRFCSSCQKEVIDFTNMTDAEILRFVQGAPGNTCGSFFAEQLNRPLAVATPQRPWARYFWGLALPAFLMAQRTKAQSVDGARPLTTVQPIKPGPTVRTEKNTLTGTVSDGNGRPIAGASIRLMGSTDGTQADSAGRFALGPVAQGKAATLLVSCIGYQNKTVEMAGTSAPVDIVLMPSAVTLDPVVVQSNVTGGCGRQRIGGAMLSVTITKVSRCVTVMRKITDTLLGKNSISIYPNPANRGGIVNIQMKKLQPGRYLLQLFATGGQLVQQATVTVPAAQFTFQWQLGAGLTAGSYVVRLTSVSTHPTVHSGKISVM